MKTEKDLETALEKINGRPYPAYRDVKGSWQFSDFIFHIVHVQSDPFASPSDVSVEVENQFPADLQDTPWKKRALEDFLIRQFGKVLSISQKAGSGKSGKISISRPGPQVLSRTACKIRPETILIRFHIGFPAQGRRIDVRGLCTILFEKLPGIVRETLLWNDLGEQARQKAEQAVHLACDQHAIREYLKEHQLAAFVADGSILPRSSGASQQKMEDAVVFRSPESLKTEIETPYSGIVEGMKIPEGITLIVGGGYHGKSTLLEALQEGVYDHIAGDGREFVITEDSAVKVRAEDGRSIVESDISPFIQNLPQKKDTRCFTSQDASGSTSQAANVAEAIEAGSRVLLMDEDTSATNFMVRDQLMQEVISPDQEPIIPFLERVENLKEQGISTILVAGSSGSFFEPADLILQMNQYEPEDITPAAKEMLDRYRKEHPGTIEILRREPVRFDSVRTAWPSGEFRDRVKIRTTGLDTVTFNRDPLDVRYLEQLVDPEQLKTIGEVIRRLETEGFDGKKTIRQAVQELLDETDSRSLDILSGRDLAEVRLQELMAAISRLRCLKARQNG